jgi:hypothetical protein
MEKSPRRLALRMELNESSMSMEWHPRSWNLSVYANPLKPTISTELLNVVGKQGFE